MNLPDGNAIIYCEDAFHTTYGKTAHGLIRFSERYKILSVIDSINEGIDSGSFLTGKQNGIPVLHNLKKALEHAQKSGRKVTHFVIGLAPDGGKLDAQARENVIQAIQYGLNVDSGLHDFLSEDSEIRQLAEENKITIRDVRKPPPRKKLHFFEGKIEKVESLKIAILGTDSAVGKRTTTRILCQALKSKGYSTEFIGTGQTAWLQGARYSFVLDSIINDFVAGEIEHAVWSAWNDLFPEFIIIEGQGSLMNPAFPGGFEILAAARPDVIIMQHAPARKEYDGFPGYPIHPLEKQIQAIEIISEKKVSAITINHEHIPKDQIKSVCDSIREKIKIPVVDLTIDRTDDIVNLLVDFKNKKLSK
jgi:uncharacterized NAD-dependent epimerase/dehydratase family protein